MQANERRRFNRQHQKHLAVLKLRNMSASAQDVHARATLRGVFPVHLQHGASPRRGLSLLKVEDIDAAQCRVHVRLGKGNKDRYVFLPQRTLLSLRRYWASHRHPQWLFPDGRTAQEKYRATHDVGLVQPTDQVAAARSLFLVVMSWINY